MSQTVVIEPGRDERTGQYQKEFSDEEFVEAVKVLEDPGTTDVEEYVGCKEKTAYKRLEELSEEGRIRKKIVGGSAVWKIGSESLKDRILSELNDREIVSTSKLSEVLDENDDKLLEVLHDLHDEGKVSRLEGEGKTAWSIA
jgi:predicted HTH transcriptional regulator